MAEGGICLYNMGPILVCINGPFRAYKGIVQGCITRI